MKRHALVIGTAIAAVLAMSSPAFAQAPPPPAPTEAAEPAAASPAGATQDTTEAVDDKVLNPAQPDFTLIGLPTTLRLPRGGMAFRVTHRFARPLGQGSFGDLVEDFFGFDAGGLIGLELRYGILSGWQVGVHRTSDRTIQFFTQYNAIRQREGLPFSVDAFASAEGTNNFKHDDPTTPTGEGIRSPAIGAIVSTTVGGRAAFYAMPVWINNTNALPEELADDNSTMALGLGTRVRLSSCTVHRGRDDAAAVGLRSGWHARLVRDRSAEGRSRIPDQLLERLWHHDGADGARWLERQRLVHRLQHHAEVLLTLQRRRGVRRGVLTWGWLADDSYGWHAAVRRTRP